METTVSEIHAYPARPEGYEEPLFHTRRSRKRDPRASREERLAVPGFGNRTSGVEARRSMA